MGVKVRKVRISILTVIALILSVLIPGQMSSQAVANITKTVTVLKSDNTPYAGALVSFVYWDEDAQLQKVVTPVTTNSSGVATLTFASGLNLYAVAVEPAAGDFSHAIWLNDTVFISSIADQSFTANLRLANLRANILKPDNSNAPEAYSIRYPATGDEGSSTSYRVTLRSGAFGIDLSDNLIAGQNYEITADSAGFSNEFANTYGLRVVSVAGTTTPVVFTSNQYTTQFAPTNNVYNFKLKTGNLIGQFKTSAGAALSFPAGVRGSVMFLPARSDGTPNTNGGCCATINAAADGSFVADFQGKSAGKYFPMGLVSGSSTIPSFMGAPIWVNSSGQFSNDGSTFESASTYRLSLKRPAAAPNLVVKFVSPANVAEPGWAMLSPIDGPPIYGPFGTSNGLASYSIPTGTYRLEFQPRESSRVSMQYSVTVAANGTATVRDAANNALVAGGDGSFSISTSLANLRIVPTDPWNPSNVLTNGYYANVFTSPQNGPPVASGWMQNGVMNMFIPDGSNYILQLSPDIQLSGVTMTRISYNLSVTNGIPTITTLSNATISANSDGSFSVPMAKSNVTGRIVGPDGKPIGWDPIKNVFIPVNVFVKNGTNWDYYQNAQTEINKAGEFGLNITEVGTYRLKFEPQGNSDVATTNSVQFDVTGPSFTRNFGDIVMNSPSLKVVVREHGTSYNLQNVWLQLRQGQNWLDGSSTGNSGVAALAPGAAGTYELQVNPPFDNYTGNGTRKSYPLVLTQNEDGSFTAAIAGAPTDPQSGAFILELGLPTLSGTVTNPDASAPIRDAQIVAVDQNSGQEMWDYSANSNGSGNWSMALPQGTYKIYAKAPWNDSTYGNGPLSAVVVVNAEGVADVANATNFTLALSWPTWSGVVKPPTGDTLLKNVQICLTPNAQSRYSTCTQSDNNGHWAMSKPSDFTGFDSGSRLEIRQWDSSDYAPRIFEGATALAGALGSYVSGQSYSNIVLRLAQPNVQITITAGGAPAANVWVNLDRDNVGWLGGAMTNASGVAKFNITNPGLGFNARANIENNPEISDLYTTTTVKYSQSDVTSGTTGGVFSGTVALDEPNFRGIIREPANNYSDGALVQYSWVEIFNETLGEWAGGVNSSSQGAFSMNLLSPQSGNYEYTITLNNSWQSTKNLAKNQYKAVISSTGQITLTKKSNNASVTPNSDSVYELALALPSVAGTVLLPDGAPVRDSWVVPVLNFNGQQMWQLGSNSKTDGSFALAAPDGNYSVEADVPWNATEPLAKSAKCNVVVSGGVITNSASCINNSTKSVTLQLRSPNLKFKLVKPGTTTGVAWANVSVQIGRWNTWARSSSDGTVALFIDKDAISAANPNISGSTSIHIWVDPPWGDSTIVRWDCNSGDQKPVCDQLSNYTYGSDFSTVNLGTVAFAEPNTKIRVLLPDGVTPVGAGAWVNLMKRVSNGSGGYWNQWIGLSSNTDSDGYASFNVANADLASMFAIEVNAPWNQRSDYAQITYEGAGTGYTYAQVNNNFNTFKLATPNLKINVKEAVSPYNSMAWGWVGVEEVDSSNNFVAWVNGSGIDNRGFVSLNLAASKRFKVTVNPGYSGAGSRTTCIVTTDSSRVVSKVTGQCAAGGALASQTMDFTLDAGNVQGHVYRPGGVLPVAGAVIYAEGTKNGSPNITDSVTTDKDGRYGFTLDPTYTWTLKVFYVNLPSDSPQLDGVTTGSAVGAISGTVTKNFTLVAKP